MQWIRSLIQVLVWVSFAYAKNEPVTSEFEVARFNGTVPWVPDYGSAAYNRGDPSGEARYVVGKRFFMNDGNWYLKTIAGSHHVRHQQLSLRLYKRTGVDKYGFTDGRPAAARYHQPIGVWYHVGANNQRLIYVADTNNHAIRVIDPTTGVTTTLAGTGSPGNTDAGDGRNATFRYPMDLVTDSAGKIYVADTHNHRIRKMNADGGNVTTLVGDYQGFADKAGMGALFNYPSGIAISANQMLYVADSNNHCVRRIDPVTREVETWVGNPEPGWKDGFGPYSRLHGPTGIAIHLATNHIYIADTGNERIRRVDENGVVSTIAGSSRGDSDGWDQDSLRARYNGVHGIAVMQTPPPGWPNLFPAVYFTDKFNNRVRAIHNHHYEPGEQYFNSISRPSNNATSVIGSVPGYIDSNSTKSQLFEPAGLAVTPEGELIVADSRNHVIRHISLVARGTLTCDMVREECDLQQECRNSNGDVCTYMPNPCFEDDSCVCGIIFTTASCGARRSEEL